MECDRCRFNQEELHQQIGTPPVYYCCRCNRCNSSCKARGSNTREAT